MFGKNIFKIMIKHDPPLHIHIKHFSQNGLSSETVLFYLPCRRGKDSNEVFSKLFAVTLFQGDQIGRIFVHWAMVYFGQFLENYRSTPNFWATIFLG
jgi:hypothetical protein